MTEENQKTEEDRTKFLAVTIIALIAVAAIAIGAVFFPELIGRTKAETPEEAVLGSIDKVEEIPAHRAEGEAMISMSMMMEEIEMKGNFVSYTTQGNEEVRNDMVLELPEMEEPEMEGWEDQDMQAQGEIPGEMKISTFMVPEGTFTCVEEFGEWMCQEEETFPGMDMTLGREELEQMIEEGDIEFTEDEVEEKEVAGRKCNYVEMEITEEIEGIYGTEEMKMDMEQCYDQETGISLLDRIEFEEQGQSVLFETRINSLELGIDIPEGTFELPADPEAAPEIPEY